MASMWSPEAVYIDDETGEKAVGHEAIAKQLDHEFAGPNANDSRSTSIRSISSPNVAVRRARPKSHTEKANGEIEYTAVHVKRRQVAFGSVSEVEELTPPPSNYEHLKELDWMIGSWIDKDDNATIQTDCEWTKNRNFMTRSFAVAVGDKMQCPACRSSVGSDR
jgi:hypothetical protein